MEPSDAAGNPKGYRLRFVPPGGFTATKSGGDSILGDDATSAIRHVTDDDPSGWNAGLVHRSEGSATPDEPTTDEPTTRITVNYTLWWDDNLNGIRDPDEYPLDATNWTSGRIQVYAYPNEEVFDIDRNGHATTSWDFQPFPRDYNDCADFKLDVLGHFPEASVVSVRPSADLPAVDSAVPPPEVHVPVRR